MLPLSSIAQDEEADAEAPAPLSDIWIMVVKPGMAAEFDEAVAAHMQFRKDAGESRSWQAYRVAVGHNMTPIQYRSCCFDWADLDTYEAEDEEKGLSANFGENVAQYVEHYHHYFERSDWDNSHWPETGTSGPYYGVTSWTNKQGRGPASSEAKEKMSQLAKSEGYAKDDNNWLWLSRIGGDETTAIVYSYANYAEMAEEEQSYFEFAVEKLGEVEASEMFDAFGNGFDDSDYTIWEYDASISTPEDEEEDEE
jgi:hypothetical protein